MSKQKRIGDEASASQLAEAEAMDTWDMRSTESALAHLRPNSLVSHVLPDLRAELRAIRKDTERAADRILAAVEALLGHHRTDAGRSSSDIARHATAILEACAFQDLVGQRLAKVDRIAEDLEARLKVLAGVNAIEDAIEVETAAETRRRDLHLHGPALNGPDVDQSAIDALFD